MARVLELNNLQGSNPGLSVITELGQYLIPAGLTWGRDIGKPYFENEKQAGFHLCFVQATQYMMFTVTDYGT